MGKLSTLAMVNEMGVISLTTYGALIYFMRNKTAKRLRKLAQSVTVGKSANETRRVYKSLKKEYKGK